MHIATIWQITLESDIDWMDPVATVISFTFLTEIPYIGGLLPSTDYMARARYISDSGGDGSVSAWGDPTLFTTLAANTIPEPGTFVPAEQGCADC